MIVNLARQHVFQRQRFGSFRSSGSTSITRTASSIRFHFRYTLTTASVQKGTRSRPGTSSAMNDGRNSQCQPISRMSATITVKSKMSSSGDIAPSANKGKMRICTASATMANTMAARNRERGDFRKESSSIATSSRKQVEPAHRNPPKKDHKTKCRARRGTHIYGSLFLLIDLWRRAAFMRILLSLRAASASAERKSYRGILGLRHRLQKREFRRLGFCVEAEMAMLWENDALKTGPERCILRRSVVCCGSARKPVGNPRLGCRCVRPKRKSRLRHSIERSGGTYGAAEPT